MSLEMRLDRYLEGDKERMRVRNAPGTIDLHIGLGPVTRRLFGELETIYVRGAFRSDSITIHNVIRKPRWWDKKVAKNSGSGPVAPS